MPSFDLKVVAQIAEVASAAQPANQAGHINTNMHNAYQHHSSDDASPQNSQDRGPDVQISVSPAFIMTPDGIMHRRDGAHYVPDIDLRSYIPPKKIYA